MLTISSASLLALTFSTAVKNSPRVVCSSNCSTGPPINKNNYNIKFENDKSLS